MIAILLEEFPYEQDIRELCMAFYPGISFIYTAGEEVIFSCNVKKEKDFYLAKVEYPDKVHKFTIDALLSRYEVKNILKRNLYEIFFEHTATKLPWGTLTGIRPTKIVLNMLEDNLDKESIYKNLKATYLMSDEKIDLSYKVAAKEKSILDKIDYKDNYSLYIGIPYCPSICSYCSFSAYPIKAWQHGKKDYVKALCKELKAVAKANEHRKLLSLYMGGGTPTSLEADELKEILSCVRDEFDMRNVLEISVEAGRPDSISTDKLKVLKMMGVGRISINPQSMNQSTLDKIGRFHTVDMIAESFNMARGLGFDNINMDIILGLPGEGVEEVKNTLEKIKKLDPESLTIHSLAVKRAARLNNADEKYRHIEDLIMRESFNLSYTFCENMELEPYYLYRQKNMAGNYENIGFSKPGRECVYNILIMEEKQDIIACGAGASSKLTGITEGKAKRLENVKDPKLYIERIEDIIKNKEMIR